MPEIKFFEVRDKATFIPVMAIKLQYYIDNLTENELFLLNTSGYEGTYVLYTPLDGLNHGRIHYAPYEWNDRTHRFAHEWIRDHWHKLMSGDVVDVEFILNETAAPKESQYRGKS